MRSPFLRFAHGIAISLLVVTTMMLLSTPSVGATGFAFSTFELSSTPGVVCPQKTGNSCTNTAAEPAIRADKSGNFYASSENGLGAGTDAWRGSNNGLQYTALQSPNAVSNNNHTGFSPGGGDTDLAVAPAKNSQGNYNVYVASLNLANVDVSTSMDQGQTWTLNPTSATIPGDDREWIAADQATKVCISYHDIATFNIDVNCSFNAGLTFTQLGDAIDSSHAFLINNNQISYNHNFTNVSIDQAGNVYSVFSDNHNVYYSFSVNQGTSWSAPVQVNKAPSNTAIYPWSTANKAGHIDIVWYGTSYYDGVNPPPTTIHRAPAGTCTWHRTSTRPSLTAALRKCRQRR